MRNLTSRASRNRLLLTIVSTFLMASDACAFTTQHFFTYTTIDAPRLLRTLFASTTGWTAAPPPSLLDIEEGTPECDHATARLAMAASHPASDPGQHLGLALQRSTAPCDPGHHPGQGTTGELSACDPSTPAIDCAFALHVRECFGAVAPLDECERRYSRFGTLPLAHLTLPQRV